MEYSRRSILEVSRLFQKVKEDSRRIRNVPELSEIIQKC